MQSQALSSYCIWYKGSITSPTKKFIRNASESVVILTIVWFLKLLTVYGGYILLFSKLSKRMFENCPVQGLLHL